MTEAKKLPKVPEALLKRRKIRAAQRAAKAKNSLNTIKKSKAKKTEIFKRAEHYLVEYRQQKQRQLIALKREAKKVANYYVPDEPKLAFVVRINKGVLRWSALLTALFLLLGTNSASASAASTANNESNFMISGFDMQMALCELEKRSFNYFGACDNSSTTTTTTAQTPDKTTETTASLTSKFKENPQQNEPTPIGQLLMLIIFGGVLLSAAVSAFVIWWKLCKSTGKDQRRPSDKTAAYMTV